MKKFDELRKLLEKYTEVNFVNRDDEGFIIDRVRIDRNDLLALLDDREQLKQKIQLVLDFYNLQTKEWCDKYSPGMTTRQLGNICREALKKSDEAENG